MPDSPPRVPYSTVKEQLIVYLNHLHVSNIDKIREAKQACAEVLADTANSTSQDISVFLTLEHISGGQKVNRRLH